MKQEDFDRLKAVCEKEGFELLNESANDNDKFFVVKKAKDIWEGVEFVELTRDTNGFESGSIFKVLDSVILIGRGLFFKVTGMTQDGIYFDNVILKPSTESAYIEQLKAEAFKRFEEIKEGDRFESPNIKINSLLGKRSNKEWDYIKKDDQFFYYDLEVYYKGKWATRVPERVKVEPNFDSVTKAIQEVIIKNEVDILKFLASKLEEYLNKD